MTTEQYLCQTMTGCHGAGDFRKWAKRQGYPFCEVFNWTSSAGDWSFIVSKDGQTWYPMFQENTHGGFSRSIDLREPLEGTAEEALETLAALCC